MLFSVVKLEVLYLKNEQECFIRYRTRERSLSVLYLIKHGLRVF